MEFIKRNARGIVILLLAVGVIAVLSASSNKNEKNEDQAKKEAAVTAEATDENKTEEEKPATTPEANVPENEQKKPETAGQSVVEKTDDNYSVVAASGDSQTKLVRRVMDNYIKDSGAELSAEQKIYTETKLVSALPKKDLIFVGDKIDIKSAQLLSTVEASKKLTQDQVKAWALYL